MKYLQRLACRRFPLGSETFIDQWITDERVGSNESELTVAR